MITDCLLERWLPNWTIYILPLKYFLTTGKQIWSFWYYTKNTWKSSKKKNRWKSKNWKKFGWWWFEIGFAKTFVSKRKNTKLCYDNNECLQPWNNWLLSSSYFTLLYIVQTFSKFASCSGNFQDIFTQNLQVSNEDFHLENEEIFCPFYLDFTSEIWSGLSRVTWLVMLCKLTVII